ncbi:MAG: hypothetical protein KC649_01340, partial [Candidatus Omnitrophica bacterium]|nr:hypothetical protein [Candidatus Omnitrophota bacterium]
MALNPQNDEDRPKIARAFREIVEKKARLSSAMTRLSKADGFEGKTNEEITGMVIWLFAQHEIQHIIDSKNGLDRHWHEKSDGVTDAYQEYSEVTAHLRSIAASNTPFFGIQQLLTYIVLESSGKGYVDASKYIFRKLILKYKKDGINILKDTDLREENLKKILKAPAKDPIWIDIADGILEAGKTNEESAAMLRKYSEEALHEYIHEQTVDMYEEKHWEGTKSDIKERVLNVQNNILETELEKAEEELRVFDSAHPEIKATSGEESAQTALASERQRLSNIVESKKAEISREDRGYEINPETGKEQPRYAVAVKRDQIRRSIKEIGVDNTVEKIYETEKTKMQARQRENIEARVKITIGVSRQERLDNPEHSGLNVPHVASETDSEKISEIDVLTPRFGEGKIPTSSQRIQKNMTAVSEPEIADDRETEALTDNIRQLLADEINAESFDSETTAAGPPSGEIGSVDGDLDELKDALPPDEGDFTQPDKGARLPFIPVYRAPIADDDEYEKEVERLRTDVEDIRIANTADSFEEEVRELDQSISALEKESKRKKVNNSDKKMILEWVNQTASEIENQIQVGESKIRTLEEKVRLSVVPGKEKEQIEQIKKEIEVLRQKLDSVKKSKENAESAFERRGKLVSEIAKKESGQSVDDEDLSLFEGKKRLLTQAESAINDLRKEVYSGRIKRLKQESERRKAQVIQFRSATAGKKLALALSSQGVTASEADELISSAAAKYAKKVYRGEISLEDVRREFHSFIQSLKKLSAGGQVDLNHPKQQELEQRAGRALDSVKRRYESLGFDPKQFNLRSAKVIILNPGTSLSRSERESLQSIAGFSVFDAEEAGRFTPGSQDSELRLIENAVRTNVQTENEQLIEYVIGEVGGRRVRQALFERVNRDAVHTGLNPAKDRFDSIHNILVSNKLDAEDAIAAAISGNSRVIGIRAEKNDTQIEKISDSLLENVLFQWSDQIESQLTAANNGRDPLLDDGSSLESAINQALEDSQSSASDRFNRIRTLINSSDSSVKSDQISVTGIDGTQQQMSEAALKLNQLASKKVTALGRLRRFAEHHPEAKVILNDGEGFLLKDLISLLSQLSEKVQFKTNLYGTGIHVQVISNHTLFNQHLKEYNQKVKDKTDNLKKELARTASDEKLDPVQKNLKSESLRKQIEAQAGAIDIRKYSAFAPETVTRYGANPDQMRQLQSGHVSNFRVEEYESRINTYFDEKIELLKQENISDRHLQEIKKRVEQFRADEVAGRVAFRAHQVVRFQKVHPYEILDEIQNDIETFLRALEFIDYEYSDSVDFKETTQAAQEKLSDVYKEAKTQLESMYGSSAELVGRKFLPGSEPKLEGKFIPIKKEAWSKLKTVVAGGGRRRVDENVKEIAVFGAESVLLPADRTLTRDQLLGLKLHEGRHIISVDDFNGPRREAMTEKRAREHLKAIRGDRGDRAVSEYRAIASERSDVPGKYAELKDYENGGLYAGYIEEFVSRYETSTEVSGPGEVVPKRRDLNSVRIDLAQLTGDARFLDPSYRPDKSLPEYELPEAPVRIGSGSGVKTFIDRQDLKRYIGNLERIGLTESTSSDLTQLSANINTLQQSIAEDKRQISSLNEEIKKTDDVLENGQILGTGSGRIGLNASQRAEYERQKAQLLSDISNIETQLNENSENKKHLFNLYKKIRRKALVSVQEIENIKGEIKDPSIIAAIGRLSARGKQIRNTLAANDRQAGFSAKGSGTGGARLTDEEQNLINKYGPGSEIQSEVYSAIAAGDIGKVYDLL